MVISQTKCPARIMLAKEAPQAGRHLPAKMSRRRNSPGFSPDLSLLLSKFLFLNLEL